MLRKTVLLTALLASAGASARWHALVIGINQYEQFSSLPGPINDARLLDQSLRRQGVKATVLLDQQARYATIKDWWAQAIRAAGPDDTIFFAFAGHGAQEAEHFPGSEAANARADGQTERRDGRPIEEDVLDETLVLGGYHDQGRASAERLVDQELLGWAQQATAKGARVFIATDACYSGGMTRSAASGRDYGDRLMARRLATPSHLKPEDRSPRGTAESARLRASDGPAFHNRLFFATPFAQETDLVNEIVVNGKHHGLLSVLVAQALDGSARSPEGQPVRSWKELRSYLKYQTQIKSDAPQTPELTGVNGQNGNDFFRPGGQKAPSARPQAEAVPGLYAAADCPRLNENPGLFRRAAEEKTADFRWQCDSGIVLASGIGVVAYDINNALELERFLAQQARLRAIRALKLPRFQGAVLGSDDVAHAVYEIGEQVTLEQEKPAGYEQLLAINLPAAGGLQPIGAEPLAHLAHRPAVNGQPRFFIGEARITTPVGNDQLLLLALKKDALKRRPLLAQLAEGKALDEGGNGDALLLDLQSLTAPEAAMALVPFATVDPNKPTQ